MYVFIILDAHRALELLEDYHTRLNKPQDKPLKNAIERVIRIFKSRLFQALLGEFVIYKYICIDAPPFSSVHTTKYVSFVLFKFQTHCDQHLLFCICSKNIFGWIYFVPFWWFQVILINGESINSRFHCDWLAWP